ncbi:MAG: hypothetical protein IPF92_18445 [Myxococcales bacterium]|nr:hypothetical protein [Myxococcales bacterium]
MGGGIVRETTALLPEEVGPFVAKFRDLYPQHFAMLYLGLVTGLRPSTLRPLRRRGAECDVVWEQGRLLVRRSHSLGDEVMKTTKQKRRYAIELPTEAMDVLRWHVATQLKTPEQEDSDLLFTELYSHLIPEHLAEARNVVSFAAEAASAAGTVRREGLGNRL